MQGLNAFYIAGHLAFAALSFGRAMVRTQMLVPTIFFLGAGFVWVSATLALPTAADVRRVSRLEYENITDPLSGTFNRRHMQRQFDQEFARAKRLGHAPTILILDLDHFRQVNDPHGHQVGDLVLRRLGQLTQNTVRDTKSVSRFGGEEFLVILPVRSGSGVTVLAKPVRSMVAAKDFRLCGNQHLRVTVSTGVASVEASTDSVAGLIQRADEAIYRAKRDGRNRVAVASKPAPRAPNRAVSSVARSRLHARRWRWPW